MTSWRTRGGALLLLAMLSIVTGACSEAAVRNVSAIKVSADVMPANLGSLTTRPEDVSGPLKKAGSLAYVSDVKMWSLRQGDRLRATIEVGRFSPDAPSTEAFRSTVAEQVGQSAPHLRRVGQQLVYVAAGNRQVFYLWFRGPEFVLLGVPADTGIGRALLRKAIDEVKV